VQEEYPLLIALEAERWTLMPITATAEPEGDSSRTQMHASHLASLTIDERLTDLRLRDPNSSKNMVSVPWEDDE